MNDRTMICSIISEMLDSPDEVGLYNTSTCFTKLEHYISQIRFESIGWCHAYCCTLLDDDFDPRTREVPRIIEDAKEDLVGE